MVAYLVGLVVVIFVYSLIMACCFDGRSEPPAPRRAIVTQEKQQHAGREQAIEDDRNSPAQEHPAVASQIKAPMNSSERGQQRQEREDGPASNGWGNIPEWIVAIAAVLAVAVYAAQTWYMGAAKTHAQTEQRAWIGISKPAWHDPPRSGQALRGTIKVTNLGLTPARIRRHFMRAWPMLEWHGFPRSLDMPLSLTPVQTIVPPKEDRELAVLEAHNLTEEGEKRLGLMVQFVVVYLDAFDNERVTVACYVYTPNAPEERQWGAFGLDDCDRME